MLQSGGLSGVVVLGEDGLDPGAFFYVYVIRSVNYPQTTCVGYTGDSNTRLKAHNLGGFVYTRKNRQWELVVCIVFRDISCARQFERYLKSQSGRAFAKKRFW